MSTIPRTAPRVLAVPAFNDNYLWLIHDGVEAAVVDPGDAEAIEQALAMHKLSLGAILLTHHHGDHAGGVRQLAVHRALPVYGPQDEAIDGVTHPLVDGDAVELPGLGLRFSVLGVPGHTRGHIAYVRDTAGARWLFCGDTLFAGGCGRLFEGTPAQMARSLDKLAALPDDTLVFCAHEYTLANLAFALKAEPDNRELPVRMLQERAKRARDEPTVPSTIRLEQATNPFLRYREAGIRATLVREGLLDKEASAVEAFAALRAWKNRS